MNITHIQTKYLQQDEFFKEVLKTFEAKNIPIILPISNKVLSGLSERINTIFVSMLTLAEIDNIYSCHILYRSILEHFFKWFYILTKSSMDMNDETAEKYQTHYFVSEYLAEQAGLLEMEDLIQGNKIKTDFVKYIVNKMPELQGFDIDNQREISNAIKQFSLKNIIKHLHNNTNELSNSNKINPLFAQTLPEYSYVSTFIHGGAYAESLMTKFKTQNLIDTELNRILLISYIIAVSTKEDIFLTYRIDRSFMEIKAKFQEFREFI